MRARHVLINLAEQDAMARQGLEPDPGTPAELAARIRQETGTWADVIKKSGIRAEQHSGLPNAARPVTMTRVVVYECVHEEEMPP